MAERFSFSCVSVCVCEGEKEKERESKMPSRRIPKHKELDFPSSLFGLGGGEGGRVEGEGSESCRN